MTIRQTTLALALVCAHCMPAFAGKGADTRGWTPGDSAALRQFFALTEHGTLVSIGGRGLLSPDGRFFISVAEHGDLQGDRRVIGLESYDAANVRAALNKGLAMPAPLGRAEIFQHKHDGLYTAMGSFEWCADSACILFNAPDKNGIVQLFTFDMKTGALAQRTDAEHPVLAFRSRSGTTIYSMQGAKADTEPYRYPLEALRSGEAGRFPGDMGGLSRDLTSDELSVARRRSFVQTPQARFEIEREGSLFAALTARISPDGRLAAWYHEEGDNNATFFRIVRFESRLETVGLLPFVHTLGVDGAGAMLWTGDSAQIVLLGVGPADGKVAVVAFTVATRTPATLFTFPAEATEIATTWDERRDRLTVSYREGSASRRRSFERRAGVWSEQSADKTEESTGQAGFGVRIAQDMNQPPRLVAYEGSKQSVLSDRDPALEGVVFNSPRRFTFEDADGRERVAWLVLPAQFRAGQPVPLVVQPVNPDLHTDEFAPDGMNTTSDAAQSLAARGIGVAQLGMLDLALTNINNLQALEAEQPIFAGRFEALIDALVEQGIARPGQIGISGFSRFGMTSLALVTHPTRTRLAASAVSDSHLPTFGQYLREAGAMARGASIAETSIGHRYWEAPDFWRSRDIVFNYDRAITPVLFSQTLQDKVTSDLPPLIYELVGAANLNGLPFQAAVLPYAGHSLSYPAQRRAYQTFIVDWLAFWLTGEEDPAPDKYAQYASWRGKRQVWLDYKRTIVPDALPQESFITTRSGLSYTITHRVSGAAALPGQSIKLNYVARDSTGRELASSAQSGPIVIAVSGSDVPEGDFLGASRRDPLNGLGRGWEQIARILHRGERATVIMPPALAVAPDMPDFGGRDRVRFDIEVAAIEGRANFSDVAVDPTMRLAQQRHVRDELRAAGIADPGAHPSALNAMGYEALYTTHAHDRALQFFQWNVILFPGYANQLYDSLGEGYLQQGNVQEAIVAYERAGAAGSAASAAIAARLKADPSNLAALQAETRAAYEAARR